MNRAESLAAIRHQVAHVVRLMATYDPPHVTREQTAALVEARRELERLRAAHRPLVAPVAMERVEVGR